MGHRDTRSHASLGPHATEGGWGSAAVKWVLWTVVTVVVIALALVCVPWVIVWCLLFDAD